MLYNNKSHTILIFFADCLWSDVSQLYHWRWQAHKAFDLIEHQVIVTMLATLVCMRRINVCIASNLQHLRAATQYVWIWTLMRRSAVQSLLWMPGCVDLFLHHGRYGWLQSDAMESMSAYHLHLWRWNISHSKTRWSTVLGHDGSSSACQAGRPKKLQASSSWCSTST